MAGELEPGLRTLIERDGREFELPERHTIEVYAGRNGPDSYVCLGARTGGSSLFALSAIEERGDAVVVRLGSLMGTSGPAGFGNYVPKPTGYPFPDGSAMSAVLLAEAERILAKHSPADFDTTIDAAPESIHFVRQVEDTEAWRTAYPSLDTFYAAHEDRHPDIRVYGDVDREIETADPLTSPGGTIPQRIARVRAQHGG